MNLASSPPDTVAAESSAALLAPPSAASAQPFPPAAGRHQASARGETGKAKGHIRILLVDDHPIVRRGLGACLAKHDHLAVVGEASDGLEAVAKTQELLPDVVLLDIDMPGMSGLAVAEVLRKELPRVKVLVLSMHHRAEYLHRVLQSGVQGYVLKEAAPEELLRAIETVNAGEAYFSPEIARLALNQLIHGSGKGQELALLTNREQEVLVLIAKGLSNKEIACQLGVGTRTVETHRERTMRKLDIHSVAGLTRFALAKGLITLRDEP